MTYAVMVKHPVLGEIVVDICDTYEEAETFSNTIYGDIRIEEIGDDEGEV